MAPETSIKVEPQVQQGPDDERHQNQREICSHGCRATDRLHRERECHNDRHRHGTEVERNEVATTDGWQAGNLAQFWALPRRALLPLRGAIDGTRAPTLPAVLEGVNRFSCEPLRSGTGGDSAVAHEKARRRGGASGPPGGRRPRGSAPSGAPSRRPSPAAAPPRPSRRSSRGRRRARRRQGPAPRGRHPGRSAGPHR